jgi:uncharacterized protein (UPF0335 family)
MDNKALEVRLDDMADDIKDIKELLTGNGSPSKGIIVRMDRLEENERRRGYWVKAALGASLTALIGLLARLVKWH